MDFREQKGFSLVELMIVVAIIGILAQIVVVTVIRSLAKARDADRIANVEIIIKALGVYNVDHGAFPGEPAQDPQYGGVPANVMPRCFGAVPGIGGGGLCNFAETFNASSVMTAWSPDNAPLVPTYIRAMPADPLQAQVAPPSITGWMPGWYSYYYVCDDINTGGAYPNPYSDTGVDKHSASVCTVLENPEKSNGLWDIGVVYGNNVPVNYCQVIHGN